MDPPRPIVILGPTAGGKSALAVALSQRLAAAGEPTPEVISADSMQVYRGLDVGTAKPTARQRAAAVHHLIDVADPREPFTVADWLNRAEAVLTDLRRRGVRGIVVGGTNLYIKALLEGMFDGPPADPLFRVSLEGVEPAELHRRLRVSDPASADRIHPNDARRLTRALEVYHATGRPISDWQRQWEDDASSRTYRHDPILLGVQWETEHINRRINQRVREMFQPPSSPPLPPPPPASAYASPPAPPPTLPHSIPPTSSRETNDNLIFLRMWDQPAAPAGESLPDEVQRLEAAGMLGVQAREALGYKQVLAWMHRSDPRIRSVDDAMEQTKVATRRFAKQQRTWLRRFRGVHWISGEARIDAAVSHVREGEPQMHTGEI